MLANSRYRLGVLLVHGIGSQPANDTLVRWGDLFIKTIGYATRERVEATVVHAIPSSQTGDKGGEAVLRLRMGDYIEHWLLSEGWWAEVFPAPTYGELVSWSVRALPWAIAIHIAGRYWQSVSLEQKWARFTALAKAIFQLLLALAIAPLFIGLLALVLLLGAVPQLREWVLSIQSTLTATVGDSLAFVESPIRAGLIRTRIRDRLASLRQRCEYSVIVAHSQGAAAVLDSFGGFIGPSRGREASSNELLDSETITDALVTFGAGTNQLASQIALAKGLPNNIGMNPVYFAIGALMVGAGTFAWLYWNVQTQRTSLNDVVQAGALLLLFTIALSALIAADNWLIGKLAQRWQSLQDRKKDILVWTVGPPMFIGMTIAVWFAHQADLPFGAVSLFLVSLLLLFTSIALVLLRGMKDAVSAVVSGPQRVSRWVDLYASDDPVPNGPTRTAGRAVDDSVPIWNIGSVFADHNSYWSNLDGFALRVVRVCAETARCQWLPELPQPTRAIDERAAWRVAFLRITRRSTLIVWFVVAALLWIEHQEDIPLPFALVDWFPKIAFQFALLLAAIALLAWLTSRIAYLIWSWWTREEQKAVLGQEKPGGNERVALVAMGMVFWALLFVARVLVSEGPHTKWGVLTDLRNLAEIFPVVLFLAFFSMYLLLKLKPPPGSKAKEIEKK